MKTRQLSTLVSKDLQLHGRAVVGAMAGGLGLFAVVARLMPREVGAETSFVIGVNLMFTLLWSDWLVTRERSKRTFAWLRSLPVSDWVLVSSKFLTAAGCCVIWWTVSSALFAPALWRPAGTALVLQCGLITYGGLSVATKWRFPWRLGHLVPLVSLLLPVLLVTALVGDDSPRRAALLAGWRAPSGPPLVAAGLLLLYTAIVAVTARWVMRADTDQLVD